MKKSLAALGLSSCLLMSMVMSTGAFASSSTTIDLPAPPTTSDGATEEVHGVSEGVLGMKKFEENSEITDAKLRADAGSLSRFSMRFSLSYYGPSPTDIGALNQPNPDGVVTTSQTAISGNMGFRYRLDSSTSISLYAGVSDLYAFHPEQNLDINSPAISYDKTFKFAGIQFLSSPGLTVVTQKTYTKPGERAGLTYLLSAVYNIAHTNFAVGSDNTFGYYIFDRAYQPADGKVRRVNVGLSPFVKYNITENFNINTSTGITLYHLRMDPVLFGTQSRLVTQKLGVGYAFTRDIYVSPYLMFYPSEPTIASTTMNIATSFSIL